MTKGKANHGMGMVCPRRSPRLRWRGRMAAWLLGMAAAGTLLGSCSGAGAVSPQVVPPGGGMALRVPGGIARLAMGQCGRAGQIIVTTPGGAYFQVSKSAEGIGLQAIEPCPQPPPPALTDMLGDGVVTRGDLTIAKAWLAQPTRRYGHGVLGDKVEAGQLRVATYDKRQYAFTLAADSVFEDLIPRVVDMEGDGQEEVLLVRSRLGMGASTILLGFDLDESNPLLGVLAESEPIGRSNRWLNPVGVADFDGDGEREIAVVITPHIGGILTVYTRKGSRLVSKYDVRGFSNHVIGSRELGMSAIVDFNEDGVPDMALPGAQRLRLRIVSFAGGRFAELRNLKYGSRIFTAVLAANFNTQVFPDLVFGLEDGTLVVLPR